MAQFAEGHHEFVVDSPGVIKQRPNDCLDSQNSCSVQGRAVDNKLLVALSELGQQQASATEATNDAIIQLLDYVAMYPSDGITFRASDMVLSAHSDAAYLNVNKARSRAGAHIMLSEDVPVPSYNGPVLTIAQIIKCALV